MEAGRSFDEALAEAKRLRIAEANSDHDIDGWDAAVKAVALANVLMGRTPAHGKCGESAFARSRQKRRGRRPQAAWPCG